MTEAMEICTKVAFQVADAMVEMSTWTSQGIHGVDGKYTLHLNFADGFQQIWSEEELKKNCEYAGLDHQNTVFSLGILKANTIVLDKKKIILYGLMTWVGLALHLGTGSS